MLVDPVLSSTAQYFVLDVSEVPAAKSNLQYPYAAEVVSIVLLDVASRVFGDPELSEYIFSLSASTGVPTGARYMTHECISPVTLGVNDCPIFSLTPVYPISPASSKA